MIANLVATIVLMGVAAPLIYGLTSWFANRLNSPVEIKVGRDHVTLDLARELPPEELQTLVLGAVESIRQGDKASLAKIVDDSHAASNRIRLRKSVAAA